jgi:Leucine-rich repeat (LRR) protein
VELSIESVSCNSVQLVDFSALRVNPTWQTVSFTNVSIPSLGRGVLASNATNVTTLKFNSNGLTAVALGAFEFFPFLDSLDFGQNSLTELPLGFFADTPNLSYLSLAQNNFRTLPSFSFLQILSYLNISFNPLANILRANFTDIAVNLVSLSMQSCSPYEPLTLPADLLDEFSMLFEFDLSNNSLVEVPMCLDEDIVSFLFLSVRSTCLL